MKYTGLCSSLIVGFALLGQSASASTVAERHGWKALVTVVPARGVDLSAIDRGAKIGKTLPYFTRAITSPLDGKTYRYSMVGTDPTKSPVSTSIRYTPIVLRVHFPGGVVLDPTQPGCGDTVAVATRFFQSPIFAPVRFVSNGIDVGDTQFLDAFQRAEFWKYVAGTNYHTDLTTTARPVILDVTAPAGSVTSAGACTGSSHDVGQIPIDAYDAMLQKVIDTYGMGTDRLPIVLTYNVVETSGGCCVLEYHSTYGHNGGTQVYGSAAYTDAGVFSGLQDVVEWTHVLGNLFDNPFVDNVTPPWHDGLVCLSSLEVGDPLGGTTFPVTVGGFTYHPQELTFYSWFFRTPSTGTGGKYSFEGSIGGAPGPCR